MDLRIAIRSGCFGPGISLVLAKAMEEAKEIRSDDKKRGAAPAGGRAAACLSEGRRCKEGGPAAGVMVCRGWPSVRRLLVCRGWLGGGDPAAIRRYLISH